MWFGESDNKQNGVDHSTFTVHLTGSDGSTIKAHETAHVSSSVRDGDGQALVVAVLLALLKNPNVLGQVGTRRSAS
jgi:hypothetical protein